MNDQDTSARSPKETAPVAEMYGTVYLRDWVRFGGGSHYIGVTGTIRIVQEKSAFGFRMTGADRNWMAEVRGPTSVYYAPGCQVIGVYNHEPSAQGDIKDHYVLP